MQPQGIIMTKEARIALLALQYMEKHAEPDWSPVQYAIKYEQTYSAMLGALPTPKS